MTLTKLVTLLCCLIGTQVTYASWTMVVLPDTQKYKTPSTIPIFIQQTQWVVDNAVDLNIGMVLHAGDITDDNTPEQWATAKSAMSKLDGVVPYMMTNGNHDIFPTPPFDRSKTMINDYFAIADNPFNSITTEKVAGDLSNTYSQFISPNGRKMLIFNLEFLPSGETKAWASGITSQNADHTTVVFTHANLEEGFVDASGEAVTRRHFVGDQLWNGFTGQQPNVELVLSGHHEDMDDTDPNGLLTTARQSTIATSGNLVHEIGFNSQEQPNGGNGFLRLMEFMDDGTTVKVKTYSPYLDVWLTNDRNQFEINLSQIPIVAVPEPSAFLFGSMVCFGLLGVRAIKARKARVERKLRSQAC